MSVKLLTAITENDLLPLESLYYSNEDDSVLLVPSYCPQQPSSSSGMKPVGVTSMWTGLGDSPCRASFCSSSCLSCCRCSFILASSWLLPELRLCSLLARASSRSRSRYTAFISAFSSLALLKSLPAPLHHRRTLSFYAAH